MSDKPRFVFSAPQPQERPRFVFFKQAPQPIFTQRYLENPQTPLGRYVDIGDEHFSLVEKEQDSLKSIPGVAVGQPMQTGVVLNLDEFQQIRFGQRSMPSSGDGGRSLFRGYLMIEPENLYDAIQRLNYVGRLRLNEGKHLEYKWKQPLVKQQVAPRIRILGDRHNQVLYVADPISALITVYAESTLEIQEIFEQLITQATWQYIEDKKRDICAQINIGNPQHGQTRYTREGNVYYTLEFNSQASFAEYLDRVETK